MNRRPWAVAGAFAGTSVALQVVVALAGESAAVPGLGPAAVHPPYDLSLGWTGGWVTLLLALSVGSGAVAVLVALVALRRGGVSAVPLPARTVALAAAVVLGVLVLVPTAGSADHLSYLAYGRIAAAGDDPYVVPPDTWRGGDDPVAGAVQPPWEETPSVYGPVATGLHALAAVAGGGSLRLTAWAWQLLAAAAFGLTGWLLDRLVRPDPAARARVAALWTLNPLLLGQLVLGAHLDVVAVAAGVAALLLAAPAPLVAGALVAVAAGVKVPYAIFGVGLLWGLRRLPWREGLRRGAVGLLGAGLVAVPVHLWSGPHTYDQLRVAARFVSWATPWRLVADRFDPLYGVEAVREVVGPLALVVALLLAALLAARILPRLPVAVADESAADAVRVVLVLGLAWVLAVPYALAWYDAVLWAPLALVPVRAAGLLDAALLVRLGTLALVYLPGRVVGVPRYVEEIVLHQRRYVAPWVLLCVVLAVLTWVARLGPARASGPPRSSRARESSRR